MAIDYDAGRALLEDIFGEVGSDIIAGTPPPVPEQLVQPFDAIFSSATQAYREGLIGCAIARLQDKKINIRLPYKNQGTDSYNGRTLDEKVVNPFLHEHRIPCSRGPFLSTFRRSIRFDDATERGLRDKEGYRALLRLIAYLETAKQEAALRQFLRFLLYRFARLREQAEVLLSRLQRMSLEQYSALEHF